jgi:hypothetical protein
MGTGVFYEGVDPDTDWVVPMHRDAELEPMFCILRVTISDGGGLEEPREIVLPVLPLDVLGPRIEPLNGNLFSEDPLTVESSGTLALSYHAIARNTRPPRVGYTLRIDCPTLPDDGTLSFGGRTTWHAPTNSTGETRVCTATLVVTASGLLERFTKSIYVFPE